MSMLKPQSRHEEISSGFAIIIVAGLSFPLISQILMLVFIDELLMTRPVHAMVSIMALGLISLGSCCVGFNRMQRGLER